MKKLPLIASLAGNALLIGTLLLSRRSHEDELFDLAAMSIRGDESHLALHARSLAALESGDPDEVEEVSGLLRRLVDVGKRNEPVREHFWGMQEER